MIVWLFGGWVLRHTLGGGGGEGGLPPVPTYGEGSGSVEMR